MATTEVDENFRAEPNGTVLARVLAGTPLDVEARDARWVQASLEGWVWTPSLESTDRDGFDLRVAADGGENLRAEPQGTILARLEEGMLLEELERIEGWIRVRRSAWIWEPSVELSGTVSVEEREGREGAVVGDPDPESPGAGPERWRRGDAAGTAILTGPDGDTLARTAPGAEMRVLARQGSWARVRMEGWAWLPEGEEPGEDLLADAGPQEVSQEPERFRGRVLTWEVHFISLERAERVRTDFYEGEPFLLARAGEREGIFVYVAVPPDRLPEVERLSPLDRIRVTGRLRTGSAALTGSPILDLMEVERLTRERDGGGS